MKFCPPLVRFVTLPSPQILRDHFRTHCMFTALAMIAAYALAFATPAKAQLTVQEPASSAAPAPNAPRRVALVFGNDAYTKIPALANARNDARTMSKFLQSLGFEVHQHLDAREKEMQDTIRKVASRVRAGDEVAFYYAGHGVAVNGNNFLLPIDVRAEDEVQVANDGLELGKLLSDLKRKSPRFTLAIVDACRDNPFTQVGKRNIGGRGLVGIQAAEGEMIVYAAGPGEQALDSLSPSDKTPNSVFTRVLIKELATPGRPLRDLLYQVQDEVARLAQTAQPKPHKQVPEVMIRMTQSGNIILIPGGPNASAATLNVAATHRADEETYKAAQEVGTANAYSAYLEAFPNGRYKVAAQVRLSALAAAPSAPLIAGAPNARGLNELLREEVKLFDVGKGKVEITSYRPQGTGPFPTIVYSHNLAGALGNAPRETPKTLALHAVAHGMAVVSISMPGHGRTTLSGRTPHACDANQHFAELTRRYQDVIPQIFKEPFIDTNAVAWLGIASRTFVRPEIGDRFRAVVQTIHGMSPRDAINCDPKSANTEALITRAKAATKPEMWMVGGGSAPLDFDALERALTPANAPQITFKRVARYPQVSGMNDFVRTGLADYLTTQGFNLKRDYRFFSQLAVAQNLPETPSWQPGVLSENRHAREALDFLAHARFQSTVAVNRAESPTTFGRATGTYSQALALAVCETNANVQCQLAAHRALPPE
jgi:hypothetical protein